MIELYKQAAKELFSVFDGDSLLRLPQLFNNDGKEFRVSEQESRMLFSRLLFEKQIPFAVEVPTVEKFSFNGKKPRSARYDLAIYEENSYKIKYAIELKALTPEREKIRKDIEKFAVSDLDCVYFHTLEKATANTYKSLLKNISASIENEKERIRGSHTWDFVIAVLESKELYFLSEKISKERVITLDSINRFLKIL